MAASMLQTSKSICQRLTKVDNGCFLQSVRNTYKYRHRGKHPDFAKSWKQKLSEIEAVPPEEDMAVNIGFPHKPGNTKVTKIELRKLRRAQNVAELERKSRMRELLIPLEKVSAESFEGRGQEAINTLASHFGIFRDLFGHAYFYPEIQLEIGYEIDEEPDMMNRVFHGNILTPAETFKVPDVHYKGDPDKLYTLCMVAPDSHLENNDKEYLHWMIGNIPGSSVDKGDVIFDYLPLFPVKGTGYHRYVFILFQQEKTLDFTKEKKSPNCTSLAERTFEMLEYYRDKQDDLTPVGLSFFQAEWDWSVRNVFHNILDMNEPRFEFLPPAPYIPRQELWPIRQPFHVYMDRYRDVKDIGEEVLLEKLKNDPFKPRPAPEKYPNLYTIPKDTPSWLRMKIQERKLKQSYWKYLDD